MMRIIRLSFDDYKFKESDGIPVMLLHRGYNWGLALSRGSSYAIMGENAAELCVGKRGGISVKQCGTCLL